MRKKKLNIKRNIIKGWITTIFGVVTIVITLNLIYKNKITFMWDGVLGITLGSLLIMSPQTIESKISQFLNSRDDDYRRITP